MIQYLVSRNKKKGFTIIELVVSLSIFAFMTALMVAKYGNFNQSVLLTNLAYDVAITIRTAQTYGLSVKQTNNQFTTGYGVYFSSVAGSNTQFVFFADTDGNKKYTLDPNAVPPIDEAISKYTLKRGATIKALYLNLNSSGSTENELNITYKRPDPDAYISNGEGFVPSDHGATIVIAGTDGSMRSVIIRENGEITVQN